jgi:hypothetical protein
MLRSNIHEHETDVKKGVVEGNRQKRRIIPPNREKGVFDDILEE